MVSVSFLFVFTKTSHAFDVIGRIAEDTRVFQKIYQTWVDGYTKRDLDTIVNILADDVIIMAENQPTVKGKAAAREFFASRIGRSGVSFADDIQEVRINGDWGYVYGNFNIETAAGKEGEKPYIHTGRYFVLYKKIGGQWSGIQGYR